jgi:hypothetical protein
MPVGIQFVTVPSTSIKIAPQEMLLPNPFPNPEKVNALAQKVLTGDELNELEWARLRVGNVVDGGSTFFRRTFSFPDPFSQYFSYGFDYFNLKHPAIQWLLRVAAAVAGQIGINAARTTPEGAAHHWIHHISWQIKQGHPCYETFFPAWQSLIEAAARLPKIKSIAKPHCPEFGEFVPGSISMTKREQMEQKLSPNTFDLFTDTTWGNAVSPK